MVKMTVYGPDGQILETSDVSEQDYYNDPTCQHKTVRVVEDNSGIDGVEARQCTSCKVGWLIKQPSKD